MTIRVTVHELLRHLSQLDREAGRFDVEAVNAFECLRAAVERFPSMQEWTYDKDGKMLPQIWFFVNGERLPDSEMARPLKDGDELLIFFNHV